MFLKTLTAVSLAMACMAANAVTTNFGGNSSQTINITFGTGTLSGSFYSNGLDITSIEFLGPVNASWTQAIEGDLAVPGLGTGFLHQEQWILGPSSITAGNYDLKITGTNLGQFVTNYAGTYSYTPQTLSAPVPEPESYAMLMAGLGALAFMGRRRGRREA